MQEVHDCGGEKAHAQEYLTKILETSATFAWHLMTRPWKSLEFIYTRNNQEIFGSDGNIGRN